MLGSLQDSFFVTESQEAIDRIDKLLSQKFPEYSRSYFQMLIEKGKILINGRPVKKRVLPEIGDEILIQFEPPEPMSVEPEEIPLSILYEDEHLLAINKPCGMVVHPAPGHPRGTFANALMAYCQGKIPGDPLRPGIVHRLDKETSGVLLAAKTESAHRRLIEKFSSRQMEKLYLAFCHGKPKEGTLTTFLGRHARRRKEMSVLPQGKEAISEIQVAAFNERMSFILIQPKTGRTHQIRVHLKHLGCPILGDSLYGNQKEEPRLFLHAYQLKFLHPITQSPIKLTAPIPSLFKEKLKAFSSEKLLV